MSSALNSMRNPQWHPFLLGCTTVKFGCLAGAACASLRQLTEVQLEAQGLQCDAHLPGCSHPVVCQSEALHRLPAQLSQTSNAPFQLFLQVCPWSLTAQILAIAYSKYAGNDMSMSTGFLLLFFRHARFHKSFMTKWEIAHRSCMRRPGAGVGQHRCCRARGFLICSFECLHWPWLWMTPLWPSSNRLPLCSPLLLVWALRSSSLLVDPVAFFHTQMGTEAIFTAVPTQPVRLLARQVAIESMLNACLLLI
jgi:hypothetical protein